MRGYKNNNFNKKRFVDRIYDIYIHTYSSRPRVFIFTAHDDAKLALALWNHNKIVRFELNIQFIYFHCQYSTINCYLEVRVCDK